MPLSFGHHRMSRRGFISAGCKGLGALCAGHLMGRSGISSGQMAVKGLIRRRQALYYSPLGGGSIRCHLCPRGCVVPEGGRGFCKVRENQGGRYYSLVYGAVCAIHLEPIEKKPFLHVLPGSMSLSVATAGCNFDCKFCQNWEIALAAPEDVYSFQVSPEDLVQRARSMGARAMAYSYVEPTIFYEYMFETARSARRAGLLNVVHSNGYINKEPLTTLCGVLDAAQIDLKGFSEAFYQKLCDGRLAPVLETLKILKKENIHVEITNLMIPTKNDDMKLVEEMCLWVLREMGPETPLHFNRFYPLHRLNRLPPTPIQTLGEARQLALDSGLMHVYIGNVPGHEGWNTYCPDCHTMVIQRAGYMIAAMNLENGRCSRCGRVIKGIWER